MKSIRTTTLLTGFLAALAATSAAHADSFTYDVNYFGMTGNIVASCDSCTLNSSDVISWAFSGQGISLSSSASDASLSVGGASFQATPSLISYAFTPSSGDGVTFSGNGNTFYLLSYGTAPSEAFLDVGNVLACQGSLNGSGFCSGGEEYGTQTIATRAPTAAPELDPAALRTSAMLLLGIVAVLRGRRLVNQANAA